MTLETPNGAAPWLKSYPDGIAWDAPMDPKPVPDMLDDTARRFGERTGFDFMGRRLTWRELSRDALNLAGALQLLGLRKGGRVALLLPNCPLYVTGYYAILRAGGTVVNLNPLYSDQEIRHMIDDSGAEMVLTADLKILYGRVEALDNPALKAIVVGDFASMLPWAKAAFFRLARRSEIARPAWSRKILPLRRVLADAGAPEPVAIDPRADIAVLQYTGGTTGAPKAAMLTHANVAANVEQARLWFQGAREGEEKTLGVIPFFHVFAMTAVMNLSVRCGFGILATPRFDLDGTLKLIDREKPTILPGVPAIFNAINGARKADGCDLSSLKYCISGGAPLPVEVKRRFEAKTGCVVVEGYGLTEASPVVCVNPVRGVNKPGSIGLPLPGTTVAIRDPETGDFMPEGGRGELCVKGPQVMKGYWNRPEDTAAVLRDGWLHTGDIATIDGDGYVFIVDRLKDMIITNGYKVYPRNVEEAIYRHPAVEECIVAGLPDEARGEIVKAWVRLKPGQTLDQEELKAFLRGHISPMEVPRRIEFRAEPLPRTLIGKLSRKDVVAQESGADRGGA